MRIYFVMEYVGGKGGVETVVTKVSHAFTKDGHDVHIFLPSPSLDPSWEKRLPNVHYYSSNIKGSTQLDITYAKWKGLSAKFANMALPDVVVATHVPQTCLYSRAALGQHENIPVVSWMHCLPELLGDAEFLIYADLHWAISKGIAQQIQNRVKDTNSIVYIGNPIEINVPRILPVAEQQFVFVGRLDNSSKRLDILFQALAALTGKWHLDIYGEGPDEARIKRHGEELGISKYITFHGWTQNVWDRIKYVTALVLTSDFEGMPMVIGEALARGIPVISSDCISGPRDLITHGINGWLFPVGDVERLVCVLEEAITLEQQQLNQMSHAARMSVLNFSTDKVLDRMKSSIKGI